MSDMTPEKLAELKALCEAATPGPWEAEFGPDGAFVDMPGTPAAFFGDAWQHGNNGGISVDLNSAGLVSDVDRRNVEFIAASRTALPALLDALEAAEAKHDSDHNLISLLQWQVEYDRKIATEWKQRALKAEERIAELERANEWRPLRDQGFKDAGLVVVRFRLLEEDGRLEFFVCKWRPSGWWKDDDYLLDPSDFESIDWRPLPEPPKDGT